MTQRTEKFCNVCAEILPLENFYICGRWYSSGCKPCHNKQRSEYHKSHYVSKKTKKRGFDLYPPNIQEQIKTMLINNMSYRAIASRLQDMPEVQAITATTLNGQNICRWVKLGFIKLSPESSI